MLNAFLKPGIEFASKTAAPLFSKTARDPKMLDKMYKELEKMAPYWEDMSTYQESSGYFIGLTHANLQADNAWFWTDEHGDLDCGVFDLMNLSRGPIPARVMGCLSGAEADLMDEHVEKFFQVYCSEFERYGG